MKLHTFRQYLPHLFILGLACLFIRPFDGNADFYHHIASGKQLIVDHTFPYTDTLTFTAYGKPWIAYAWGSGVLLYALFSTFGPVAISLCFGLIAYITLLLLWEVLGTYGHSSRVKLLTIGMVLPLLLIRFPHRPEVFTYPFLLSILYVGRRSDKNPSYLWGIPLVLFFWSNIYGSSTLIGLLFSLFFLGRYAIYKKRYIQTGILALLSIAASLMNPNGLKSLLYILFIPKVATYEGEWAGLIDMLRLMPQSYLLGAQYSILVYVLILLFSLICMFHYRKRLVHQPFEFLCSIAILLPLFAFRQIALAGILIAPLLAIILSSLSRRKIVIYAGGIAASGLCALMLYAAPPGLFADTSQVDTLISFSKNSRIHGHVLNMVQIGSIIGYHLSPTLRPFVDTRDDLFLGSQSQKDLYDAALQGIDIRRILVNYDVDVIIADLITDTIDYQSIFYSQDWSIVYLRDRYMIAVRRQQAQELGLIPLTFADPFSPTGAKRGSEEEALRYYKSQLDANPNSYFAHFTYGSLLLATGHAAEALRVFESSPRQSGPYKKVFENEIAVLSTIALSKMGQCAKANTARMKISGTSSLGVAGLLHPISTKVQKANAWYALLCMKDQKLAADSMQQYEKDPNIPSREKNNTKLLFTREYVH